MTKYIFIKMKICSPMHILYRYSDKCTSPVFKICLFMPYQQTSKINSMFSLLILQDLSVLLSRLSYLRSSHLTAGLLKWILPVLYSVGQFVCIYKYFHTGMKYLFAVDVVFNLPPDFLCLSRIPKLPKSQRKSVAMEISGNSCKYWWF